MISKEEIENKDMILAIRIKRIFDYIEDEIQEKGEISQLKEDVFCTIHELLERQLSKDELTVCEIVVKNREAYLQHEKDRRMQEYIQQLENKYQKVIKAIENEEIATLSNTKNRIEKIAMDEAVRQVKLYKQHVLEIMRGEE